MNILQKMEADYRAEVIATQLLAHEQDFNKIIIERLGGLQRTHTKDIHHTYEDISEISLDRYTVLQSFRQSIYEAIPENIFHPPTLGGLGKSTQEIVEEIKEQRKKENEARTFFKPFEQEAPYLEMQALMLELMYEQKGTYDNLYHLFEQGWPVIKKLPRKTALSFIYILPILNEVRGKKDWIEKCLSFLSGFPVVIQETFTAIPVAKEQSSFTTGSSVLGLSSTFSGRQDDGFPTWMIHIGPVPDEEAVQVLPQSGFEELIDTLLEYMAPANIFIRKKIEIPCAKATTLSGDMATTRLGYTFTI